jgi:hypothetical protein
VIVWTLRNVVVFGDPVESVAREALTSKAQDVLRNLREAIWDVEWMARNVQGWIMDILGFSPRGSMEILKVPTAPTDLVFRI